MTAAVFLMECFKYEGWESRGIYDEKIGRSEEIIRNIFAYIDIKIYTFTNK